MIKDRMIEHIIENGTEPRFAGEVFETVMRLIEKRHPDLKNDEKSLMMALDLYNAGFEDALGSC